MRRAIARDEPGVQEHESGQQAAAREEPGVQEHESEQRAAAREVPGVGEHESLQRAAAREEPGVREEEQSANTMIRAIARDEPGVREHKREQRAEARTRTPCENIPMWISLCLTTVFSQQGRISVFKFPKRFSEFSWAKSSLYSLYLLY